MYKSLQAKVLFIFFVVFLITTLVLKVSVGAIEYGGIGGKPAYPKENNPRTQSIFIFDLEPGTQAEDGVLVVNNSTKEKTLLVYATDSQKSTDGSFACEQFADEKNDVGSWIKLEKEEITLKPSTSEIVPFTIIAPENASVGEENGCVLIQEKTETSGVESGVSLSFRTGLRVVVTIPGEQIRKLDVKDLNVSTTQDNKLKTVVEIENQGNVSIDTIVKLKPKYLFLFSYNEIENQYPILRGETSVFNFEIPKPIWGGIIKLEASAEYDPSSEASVGIDSNNPNETLNLTNKYVFILPTIKGLIIEILFIALLIAAIYFILKKKKQYKSLLTASENYTVTRNDTLESLALERKISWKAIAKINNLKPPYQLKKGMVIRLPKNKPRKYG